MSGPKLYIDIKSDRSMGREAWRAFYRFARKAHSRAEPLIQAASTELLLYGEVSEHTAHRLSFLAGAHIPRVALRGKPFATHGPE